jgi:hypothetical protein
MFSATEEKEVWRIPDQAWLDMEDVDDGEGWRTPDPSWLEMEAAEGREIFYINLFLLCEEEEEDERKDKEEKEVESEEGEDDDWNNRPWSEVEKSGWCGRGCCQEIIMAARKGTKAALAAGLPAARFTEQRKM